MTLVVLPFSDLRERLFAELIACGINAVAVPNWSTAIEVARTQPVSVVVFELRDTVKWREGVGRLRAACGDLILVALERPVSSSGEQPDQLPSQPTNTEPPREPGQQAPLIATVVPAPIVVPIHEDIARLAVDIARLIAAAISRSDFKEQFDRLHVLYQAGDESAADDIWRLAQRTLGSRLRGWALAHGHPEPEEVIKDVITDAVMKALEPGRYNQLLDPKAWILRIGQNGLCDRWRHVRAGPRIEAIGLGTELDQIKVRAAVFQDPVAHLESERSFQQRLRTRCRNNACELRLLRLRYLERAPVAEQATAIGGGHLPHPEQVRLVDRWIKRIAARREPGRGGRARIASDGTRASFQK